MLRKPHSQLLGEGGETKNSLELTLAQISSAVDIGLHLKNYLLSFKASVAEGRKKTGSQKNAHFLTRHAHSYLNASTGRNFEARHAGYSANMVLTPTPKPNASRAT